MEQKTKRKVKIGKLRKTRKLRKHTGGPFTNYDDRLYGIWTDIVVNPGRYYKPGAEICR